MTNWNQIVFVTKLLLVKDSCNMGANNTITTASSSSSGAPRRPTSFLTRNTCSPVEWNRQGLSSWHVRVSGYSMLVLLQIDKA